MMGRGVPALTFLARGPRPPRSGPHAVGASTIWTAATVRRCWAYKPKRPAGGAPRGRRGLKPATCYRGCGATSAGRPAVKQTRALIPGKGGAAARKGASRLPLRRVMIKEGKSEGSGVYGMERASIADPTEEKNQKQGFCGDADSIVGADITISFGALMEAQRHFWWKLAEL
ncbi:hypothetical protein NDU88_012040 [Pleurodeles waltl]|uniref:Uncharacterized protein n=1 Tax=Pleurodeles waltl TaxID=8319 RepID=A0AAV7QZK1_PLEWA|nr:hypothetical protein NDU88_012040 [Pleurodeles waltl]